MIEKNTVINILEDIQNSLRKNNIEEGLKTLDIYRKNLELSCNPKLKKLIEEQSQLVNEYGESNKRVLRINKKIDKEMQKIFNN